MFLDGQTRRSVLRGEPMSTGTGTDRRNQHDELVAWLEGQKLLGIFRQNAQGRGATPFGYTEPHAIGKTSFNAMVSRSSL